MKAAAAASLTRDELPAVMFHVIWDITTAFGLRSRDGRFPRLNRHRALLAAEYQASVRPLCPHRSAKIYRAGGSE